MAEIETQRTLASPERADVPEGYLTYGMLGSVLGVSEERLRRIVRDLGIEPSRYPSFLNGKLVPYLSPPEIEQIKAHPDTHLQPAPEGYINKNQAKDMLGMSFKQLTKILGEVGIEPETYLTPKRFRASFLSPEQLERVKAYVELQRPPAPESFVSYNQTMTELGLAEESMERICTELGIEPQLFKNQRARTIKYITSAEAAAIKGHSFLALEPAPPNYVSVRDIETATDLSDTTVVKIVKELGLEWSVFKNAVLQQLR